MVAIVVTISLVDTYPHTKHASQWIRILILGIDHANCDHDGQPYSMKATATDLALQLAAMRKFHVFTMLAARDYPRATAQGWVCHEVRYRAWTQKWFFKRIEYISREKKLTELMLESIALHSIESILYLTWIIGRSLAIKFSGHCHLSS